MTGNDLLRKFDTKAVIFDLDGTLLDNNYYHRIAWIAYLERIGRHITEEEYNQHMNGRTNDDVIDYIFGNGMDTKEVREKTLEKESVYREMYKPYIKPVEGLIRFLDFLFKKEVPMAIATSGIQPNINFMFENVPIKKYFKTVVNSSHISKGKPDPEIYLKTAELLNVSPVNCLVFEDAVVGINAARNAGMRVVGITTTQSSKDLSDADYIINTYDDILA